ncbi:MAG: ribonuclease HII, partial [bacterium]
MTFPNFEIETDLLKQGHNFVAGLDEAGRGPLAGPIVASAVILPSQFLLSNLPKLNDSKKLSPKVREELHIEIKKIAVSVGIGIVEVEIVDKIGIGKANKLAFLKAILNLNTIPTFIVTDYLKLTMSDISLLKLIKVPNLIDL